MSHPGNRAILFLASSLVLLLSAEAGASKELAQGRTILFVDDHEILYRSGTNRVFQPPRRHADKALLGLSKPWELAIGYVTIHREPKSGKYQLWYQAYAGNRAGERRLKCVVCYAESRDGIHFDRPELDLFPFKGEKSNIVLVANAGHGDRYGCSVLVDPDEQDAARRYKMAYYDWSVVHGREEPGLHVAFSPDGIRWTKHNQGTLLRTLYGGRGWQPPFTDENPFKETPVNGKPARKTWSYPLTASDVIDVFWDPVRRVFVLLAKFWMDSPNGGAAWKNGIVRCESKDFVNWSKPQIVLTPDDDDGPDVDFHGAPGFYHKGRYFALNQILNRRGKLAIDLELMTSRDGIVWERPFRKQFFLARSQPGLFDSRTILSNSTPIMLEDEMRFYYGASNVAPLEGVKSDPGQRSGVGMVSLPLDRFAGLRPVAKSEQLSLPRPLENIGQFTLKPLDLQGCTGITVNADAAKGSVRVELLTEDGYRVRGYSRDDAAVLQGDSLRHQVRWKERGLDQLPRGRYLLRFHLDNAAVFAVSFQ